jgi:hypothetical protein
MNSSRVLLAMLCIAGCSPAPKSREASIMDKIEKRIRLPQRAAPLAQFVRYYAYRTDGKVRGIYLPPDGPETPDVTCVEVAPKAQSRKVPCPPAPRRRVAGERIWLQDANRLPGLMAAGCTGVSVVFDPLSDKLEQVECMGLPVVPVPPELLNGS